MDVTLRSLLNLDQRDQVLVKWCQARGLLFETLLGRIHSYLAGQAADTGELAKETEVMQALMTLTKYFRKSPTTNTHSDERE